MSTTNPPYRVLTDRLVLRCWSPTDAPALRESLDASDEHLRPWIPFMRDEPRSLQETIQRVREHRAKFDRDEHHRYAIFTPDEATLLGETMLLDRAGPDAREIGYWMDARHSGRGHATQAAAAMVRIGFCVHRVARLEIHCSPENAASIAVARRLGFTLEATLKARTRGSDGALQDSTVWTLFADDFRGTLASRLAVECFDAVGRRMEVASPGPLGP